VNFPFICTMKQHSSSACI